MRQLPKLTWNQYFKIHLWFYKADNKNNLKTRVTCEDTNIKLLFIYQTASIPQY